MKTIIFTIESMISEGLVKNLKKQGVFTNPLSFKPPLEIEFPVSNDSRKTLVFKAVKVRIKGKL